MSDNENNVEQSGSAKRIKLEADFLFKPLQFQKLPIDPDPLKKFQWEARIICEEDENVYSYGGKNAKLWKLNVVANTYSELQTTGIPHPADGCSSVVIHEGRLIAFGGVCEDESLTNEVNVCDLKTLNWRQEMTTGPAPVPRYCCLATMHEYNLYIVGGPDDSDIDVLDVHKLDLRTSTWETLWTADGSIGSMNGQEPTEEMGCQVAVHLNKIILLGVFNYLGTNNLSKIPAFDLESRTWACLNTVGDSTSTDIKFPSSDDDIDVLQRGHEAFLWGHGSSYGIWKLNLTDLRWTKLNIPYPNELCMWAATITPSGCLLAIFGNSSTNAEAGVWKCWLVVPTLKEMCWESIQHFQPNLMTKSKDQLIESGIPRDLVRRLDNY